MRPHSPPFSAVLLLAACIPLGCKDKGSDSAGAAPPPPPPIEVAKPGTCASGGGEDSDAVSAAFFPRALKGAGVDYCLDPQGEIRAFGDKAKLTLEDVCTTAVDGECEVYKRYGLKRFVSLRYVDGTGGGGSVEVYLSQFVDAGGAYGMFTKRVVADGDPADPSAPRTLEAGGAGAIGTGRAYVWRGDELAELQYINENESPEQLAKSSEAVLTPLGKQLGAKLPGALDKPPAAAALPSASLVSANAITYFTKDALGVPNVGAGAVGYYKDGDKRYRLLAIQKTDADQATDVMNTYKKRQGASAVAPGVGDEGVHEVLQASTDAPKVDWTLARNGALVAGVGDEETLLRPGQAPDEQAKVRVSKDDAAARLKAWSGAFAGAPAGPAADARCEEVGEGGALPAGGGTEGATDEALVVDLRSPARERCGGDEARRHRVVVPACLREIRDAAAVVADDPAHHQIADPLSDEGGEGDEDVSLLGVADEGHRADAGDAVLAAGALFAEGRVEHEAGERFSVAIEASDLPAGGDHLFLGFARRRGDETLHGVEVDVEAGVAAVDGVVQSLGADDGHLGAEHCEPAPLEPVEVSLDVGHEGGVRREGLAVRLPALVDVVGGAEGPKGGVLVQREGADDVLGAGERRAPAALGHGDRPRRAQAGVGEGDEALRVPQPLGEPPARPLADHLRAVAGRPRGDGGDDEGAEPRAEAVLVYADVEGGAHAEPLAHVPGRASSVDGSSAPRAVLGPCPVDVAEYEPYGAAPSRSAPFHKRSGPPEKSERLPIRAA